MDPTPKTPPNAIARAGADQRAPVPPAYFAPVQGPEFLGCRDRLGSHADNCDTCWIEPELLDSLWEIPPDYLCPEGRKLQAWHLRNQVPAGSCPPVCRGDCVAVDAKAAGR